MTGATFCATLVDEWARAGMTDAVVAPGSRSTPMALALVAEPHITNHVFLDERSAGFFALGLGLRSGRPAVVLTTSGTAAAELHPAVIEAHHAGVPLLVVTADRPPEAHGVGSAQTIEQADLYGTAVRWRADPGVPGEGAADTWRSLAARAVAEALGVAGRPGPVHLNLAFGEPLVGDPGPLPPGRPDGEPWHRAVTGERGVPSDIDDLAVRLSGRTGVIVAGAGTGDPVAVHRLADQLGWPVLADARSPARIPAPATVAAFDALLRQRPFADRVRPDVVLRLGTTPTSRVLPTWLVGTRAWQVAVEAEGTWLDPDHSADLLVAAEPDRLCAALADLAPEPAPGDWADQWSSAEKAAQAAFDDVLAQHSEPTEPGVARALVAGLPSGAGLLVASSMPIRDVEWYGRPRQGLRIMANRGANGIDGMVSTILGAAAGANGAPTVGLLGDLAFLHDAGGLLGAAERGLNAALVVVDNGGGGIFSFLPQVTVVPPVTFERLFGTPHQVDIAAMARLHGLAATEVTKTDELVPTVTTALDGGGVTVLVVRTDRATNVAVHDELHASVAGALA
jgi:2-succinyl-5-enolpyruvyl-6-hydroxy-3-cyclohexene-1-carboxylate synthase